MDKEKTYIFQVTITGSGETIEEAYQDAIDELYKEITGGNKMEKDMRTTRDVDGETYNYDNNSPMCLNNPWSGRPVEIKKSDKLNLDNWAILMDDELREHIHNQLAPCSDWDFIRAWYELVDTDEASRVILGS
jgi:hypothetical protein